MTTTELQLAEEGSVDDFDGMLAERKLDGIRVKMDGENIISRRGKHYTHKLPEIEIPENMVLDGELITHDFEFNSVLGRVGVEDEFRIRMKSQECPAYVVVFDILEKDDEDLKSIPFEERKEYIDVENLDNVLEATTHNDPTTLWEECVEKGWEGIMLKDPEASYREGRNDSWLKLKAWEESIFDVVTHETTENDGVVVKVDIGADEPQNVVVNGHADQKKLEGANQVEIQFLERINNGDKLRKPSFKGIIN